MRQEPTYLEFLGTVFSAPTHLKERQMGRRILIPVTSMSIIFSDLDINSKMLRANQFKKYFTRTFRVAASSRLKLVLVWFRGSAMFIPRINFPDQIKLSLESLKIKCVTPAI